MISRAFHIFGCILLMMLLHSCSGIFDGIYDKPTDLKPVVGQLVVDASKWDEWHYIDFKALHRLALSGDIEGLLAEQTKNDPYPIPMGLTGESDGKSGLYLYWFDVFGQGIGNNEFRGYTPCDAQKEPPEWSIAVHRNNVRTNNASVCETDYSAITDLPVSSEAFADAVFCGDEWSENEVWCSQEQMLQSIVPSQGIKINKVLSGWLKMEIPPMPPVYKINNHVFVVRFGDGSYAAVQLENYISPAGEKCWLTINYKYPY